MLIHYITVPDQSTYTFWYIIIFIHSVQLQKCQWSGSTIRLATEGNGLPFLERDSESVVSLAGQPLHKGPARQTSLGVND